MRRTPVTAVPGNCATSAQRWFLVNLGILYGITFAATCVATIAQPGESFRWAWALAVPLVGLLGLGFTFFFTFPSFVLYLVGLRLGLRRWPRRLTSWILTPLLTWAVLWTWPTESEGSWWNFGIAIASVSAAAALVRI